jgi:hypothetical protein
MGGLRGRQMIDSVNSFRLAVYGVYTIVFNVQPTALGSKSLSGQCKSR